MNDEKARRAARIAANASEKKRRRIAQRKKADSYKAIGVDPKAKSGGRVIVKKDEKTE